METHVAHVVVHLPAHKYFVFSFVSIHEGLAPIAEDPDTHAYSRSFNGCIFT